MASPGAFPLIIVLMVLTVQVYSCVMDASLSFIQGNLSARPLKDPADQVTVFVLFLSDSLGFRSLARMGLHRNGLSSPRGSSLSMLIWAQIWTNPFILQVLWAAWKVFLLKFTLKQPLPTHLPRYKQILQQKLDYVKDNLPARPLEDLDDQVTALFSLLPDFLGFRSLARMGLHRSGLSSPNGSNLGMLIWAQTWTNTVLLQVLWAAWKVFMLKISPKNYHCPHISTDTSRYCSRKGLM